MPQVSKADVKLSFDDYKDEWRMARNMEPAKGPDDYPTLAVEYNHQGEFTFKILNPKGTTFAEKNPFVPKRGKENPADFARQFDVTGEGTDTLTVKVANAHKDKPGARYDGGEYNYELHFTGKPPLDPIITNGGCCHGRNDAMLYYALGAIALLALAFLVLRPMMAKRRRAGGTQDRDRG